VPLAANLPSMVILALSVLAFRSSEKPIVWGAPRVRVAMSLSLNAFVFLRSSKDQADGVHDRSRRSQRNASGKFPAEPVFRAAARRSGRRNYRSSSRSRSATPGVGRSDVAPGEEEDSSFVGLLRVEPPSVTIL
jgi:hypothetical protein